MRLLLIFLTTFCFCLSSPAQQKVKTKEKTKIDKKAKEIVEPIKHLDTTAIISLLGPGKANNGEYKITIPQNDLSIMVDDFKIIPAMGLGTWVAFTPTSKGAMVMGDIIITETDLKPVQAEVIKN